MGRNELRAPGLAALISATLLVLASDAKAGGGYLAAIGPTPLRFQPARTKPAVTLPPLPPDSIAAIEPAPAARSIARAVQRLKPGTFLIPGSPLEAIVRDIGSGIYQFTPQHVASPKPVEQTAPAEDMLGVTPQMLVDYFKPVHGSTNGSNIAVVVPVPFTPPTPAPPPSSATYKTP